MPICSTYDLMSGPSVRLHMRSVTLCKVGPVKEAIACNGFDICQVERVISATVCLGILVTQSVQRESLRAIMINFVLIVNIVFGIGTF